MVKLQIKLVNKNALTLRSKETLSSVDINLMDPDTDQITRPLINNASIVENDEPNQINASFPPEESSKDVQNFELGSHDSKMRFEEIMERNYKRNSNLSYKNRRLRGNSEYSSGSFMFKSSVE